MYGIETWSEKLRHKISSSSDTSNYPSTNEDEKHKLSFAFQNLSEIDNKMLPKRCDEIYILDLTENNFIGSSDLRFLIEFPNLKTLILDKNQIQSNFIIPELLSLTTLWVNHNKIENLTIFINNLTKSTPNLSYLSMINNKAAPSYFNGGSLNEYNDYRLFVVSKLENLKMLDYKEISDEEKLQSKMVYGISNKKKSTAKVNKKASIKKQNSKPMNKNNLLQDDSRIENNNSNSDHLELGNTLISKSIKDNGFLDVLPDINNLNQDKINENDNKKKLEQESSFLEKLPDIVQPLQDDIIILPTPSSSPVLDSFYDIEKLNPSSSSLAFSSEINESLDLNSTLQTLNLPNPGESEFDSLPDIDNTTIEYSMSTKD